MQKIYYEKSTKLSEQTIVALGNFDGVHNGHRVLIEKVVSRAKQLRAKSCIVTFEPHTREIIEKSCVIKLTTTAEKLLLFENLGVDICVIIPFNEYLSKMPKSEFQSEILQKQLNCKEFISGENQKYGNNSGLFANYGKKQENSLNDTGKNYFPDAVISLYGENNIVVSSTEIRKLLLAAHVDEAVNLLGHPYLIMGTRIRGKQLGSVLGYPTLNFTSPSVMEKIVPPSGVYVAQVQYGKYSLNGCLYYGDCPTFGNRELHIEFFSLDEIVSDPMVGGECALWLHRFIRHDEKFNSQQELVLQIKTDVEIIKRYFFKE